MYEVNIHGNGPDLPATDTGEMTVGMLNLAATIADDTWLIAVASAVAVTGG